MRQRKSKVIPAVAPWVSVGSTSQSFGGHPGGPPAVLGSVHSNFAEHAIRRRGHIFRFASRGGEHRASEGDTVDRTEFSFGSSVPLVPGDEVWISYRLMIEPALPGEGSWVASGSCNIGQFHGGMGSPVITWQYENDTTLELWTRPTSANTTEASNGYAHTIRYSNTSFVRGRWYAIVMRIKTAPSGSGSILHVWVNGTQVVNLTNIPIGYSDSTENYWKCGVYRSTSSTPLNVQFANMEIGLASDWSGTPSNRVTNPL